MNFKELFSSWKGALLIALIALVIGIIIWIIYSFMRSDTPKSDTVVEKLDQILTKLNTKPKVGSSRSDIGFQEV